MTKLVGTPTTHARKEIPGFKGQTVRIFGVMRGALRDYGNIDADDYFVVDHNRGNVARAVCIRPYSSLKKKKTI